MTRSLEFHISDDQTIIKVSTTLDLAEFPVPGIIQIEDEKIKYGNITNREFIDCVRGYDGTDAVAHVMGSVVTFVSTIPEVWDVPADTISVDSSEVAGETRLLLWDVDADEMVRVSVGEEDSGGVGYKVLRIPN